MLRILFTVAAIGALLATLSGQVIALHAHQATIIISTTVHQDHLAIVPVLVAALTARQPLMDHQELAATLTLHAAPAQAQAPVQVPATVVLSALLLNSERPL